MPHPSEVRAPPEVILGDPHVGHNPEADAALLQALDVFAERRAAVVIMGDLFVAWIARDRFLTNDQRRFLDAIRAVRAAGGRVRFVVGNRDYLAEDLEGDVFDAVYSQEVVVDVGGARTLLLHGDGLNPTDRPYRIWRAVSKNAVSRRLLARLPGFVGRQLAERTERGLRDVNRQYKTGPLPRAALEAVGVRAKTAGAVRAIVGHFHANETISSPGVPVHIAPGWFEHRRVLLATPGGLLAADPFALDFLTDTSPAR